MIKRSWQSHLSRYSMSRIGQKLREKGCVWCASRLLQLCWQGMQSRLDRLTRPIRVTLWRGFDNFWNTRHRNLQGSILYAFYDLQRSPTNFNFVEFLVLAELERQKADCDSLHVVIVPGPADGFRARREHYDIESKRWRLQNILVPSCALIPSCRGVTVCTSREEAHAFEVTLVKHVFPKAYTVRFPQYCCGLSRITEALSQGAVLPSIQPSSQALRFAKNWIEVHAAGRKVITITLREASYEQCRNSNLEDWGMFARRLDPTVYCPVVLRDTEVALNSLPSSLEGLLIFPEAVWNIELRAALYELSYLNMLGPTGPGTLCCLNQRVRYLQFKLITPECYTESYYHEVCGLKKGDQLQPTNPFQKWVWEDDRLDVIEAAFREMCERIESIPERTWAAV